LNLLVIPLRFLPGILLLFVSILYIGWFVRGIFQGTKTDYPNFVSFYAFKHPNQPSRQSRMIMIHLENVLLLGIAIDYLKETA